MGRRVADRCYGPGYNNTKQRLRLRVFIPLTIEAWLRGLLPPVCYSTFFIHNIINVFYSSDFKFA